MRCFAIAIILVCALFQVSCSNPFEQMFYPRILQGADEYFLVQKSPDIVSSHRIADNREMFEKSWSDLGYNGETSVPHTFIGYKGKAYYNLEAGLFSLNLHSGEIRQELFVKDLSFVSTAVMNEGSILVRTRKGVFVCTLAERNLDFIFPFEGRASGEILNDTFILWNENTIQTFDRASYKLLNSFQTKNSIHSVIASDDRLLVASSDKTVKILAIEGLRTIGTITDFILSDSANFYFVSDNRFVAKWHNYFSVYEFPTRVDKTFSILGRDILVHEEELGSDRMYLTYYFKYSAWGFRRSENGDGIELFSQEIR